MVLLPQHGQLLRVARGGRIRQFRFNLRRALQRLTQAIA
jgi:hypothetical protein